MAKPTDPEKYNYMFSDDMKFVQKVVIFHPHDPKKILILKRSMDSYSRPGDWDFPGGNVLFGEPHDESVLREIKEETGLLLTDLHPIQIITRYNDQTGIYYLFINYRGHTTTDSITLSHEHTEYRWVTFEEFKALHPIEFMYDSATAAYNHTV